MDKIELKSKVQDAIRNEEVAAQIYTEHVSNIMEWTGLDEEAQQEIIKKFRKIIEESKKHKKYYEELRERV